MGKPLEEAPKFSRRVHTVAELQFALAEAVRATGLNADEVEFDGIVRLEAEDAGQGAVTATTFHLTILKRN